MSDAEQQSPRTAIRKWLQLTENTSTAKLADALPEQQKSKQGSRHHSRRGQWTRCPSESKDPRDEKAAREHGRHSKIGSRQKHVTDKALFVDPLQARPLKRSEASAAVNPDCDGLAERLGLHAPFPTFKDRSDDNIPEAQSRPRKRRRRKSSTSSYLEPAAANDLADNDHARFRHAMILRRASERPAVGDRGNDSSHTASRGAEIILPSPEKLLKPYEKRPRHKTRIDRYELKESSRHSKKTKQDAKKDRGDKKQKKQKRKEKSGAALMHSFAAQNVVHDRLTLKPERTLGLFGKGRASSPVRRRGLPDLAFSEMAFLTSRQEKPKDSLKDSSNKPSSKKKRRMSAKEADAEADFSRYFLSAKPTSVEVNTSHRQRYQQDKRQSRIDDSPQAYVDRKERPFLGFGSRGPNTSISPAKSPVNRDSRSLRRGVPRSPTPSTSYVTWSQSRAPSYNSPPPDRRHHIEPLESSKLSNRKRTSPSPKEQHSLLPVSPHRIPTISSGAQGSASRPSSKHENPNKAPRQNSKLSSPIGERLMSREKSQNRGDTGTIELDAAKSPQDIQGSIPDVTKSNEAATHDCAEMVLPTLNQAPRQSSGYEPRRQPPAHSPRPLSAQMQTQSRHKDPLDDVLEALLKDCYKRVALSDAACHTTLGHPNSHVREETKSPVGTHEDSPKPARAFVNSIHATGPLPLASASGSSRGLCSANPQLAPASVESMATHTLSRGSLHDSKRPSLGYPGGYPSSPMHNQTDARNAWNGYEALFARQHEQSMPQTSIGHTLPNGAVQDDFIGMLAKSDHGVGPREQALDRYPAELRDGFDDYRPDSSKSLQERNEIDNDRNVGGGEWYDQHADYQASNGAGESSFHVSYGGVDNGIMALNDANGYQEKGQSFDQRVDEPEIEDQRFTTNVSDTYHSWRPRERFSSTYGLEACPTSACVQDVGSALSGFWTPHKLY